MILDKITHLSRYFKSEVFDAIFRDLKSYTIDTENGTYQTGKGYYFKVMEYTTQISPNIVESHRKEVDIQIILKGKEAIRLYDASDVSISRDYEESDDCVFYHKNENYHSEINLNQGYMAIFFNTDVHQPAFAIGEPQRIKKIVIKVDEKLFT